MNNVGLRIGIIKRVLPRIQKYLHRQQPNTNRRITMKPKNITAAIFAVLVLCLGSVAQANDLSGQLSGDVMTVNVNEADAVSIANTLVGIGISRAQAIVDYRDQYGRFYSAQELTSVKGVGQSTVEKNLSRISIE
jgi:competence protein ComEA